MPRQLFTTSCLWGSPPPRLRLSDLGLSKVADSRRGPPVVASPGSHTNSGARQILCSTGQLKFILDVRFYASGCLTILSRCNSNTVDRPQPLLHPRSYWGWKRNSRIFPLMYQILPPLYQVHRGVAAGIAVPIMETSLQGIWASGGLMLWTRGTWREFPSFRADAWRDCWSGMPIL